MDKPAALEQIDIAITALATAHGFVDDNEPLTGRRIPGSEGYFGPVQHDLVVLRGRIVNAE